MALFVRRFRLLPVLVGAALCCFGCMLPNAGAQADPGAAPQTRLDKFASHFDLAASGIGEFDTSVSGRVMNSVSPSTQTLSQQQYRVVAGAMGTLRAQRSPWVGGEFNYRWAKYTYTFNFTDPSLNFYTQNTANEFTLGYIAHPNRELLGLKPFLGAGAGTVEFKPSRSSGSGLPVQARAAYYYTVGGDKPIYGDTFGLRVGFRQVFYLAPDFGQNYLLIKKEAISSEPTLGLYVHF